MAYAATIVYKPNGPHRPGRDVVVELSETEASATTEATLDIGNGFQERGVITRVVCILSSGSGTTVDPIIGDATNPSGINVMLENDAAAATIDLTPEPPVPFQTDGDGNLYWRSVLDSGTDNTVVSRLYLTIAR